MRTLYFQLKRMEESQQEATEKEVERILGLLQTYFREDRKYDTQVPDGAVSLLDASHPTSPPSLVAAICNVLGRHSDGLRAMPIL